MGCPDYYYKKALQRFAYILNDLQLDENKADKMSAENDIEILEAEIESFKNNMSSDVFYYYAGHACQYVLAGADRDGDDGFNAGICGLGGFELFIGLNLDGDEEEE